MSSVSAVSDEFCAWRSHIDKGSQIQAKNGPSWYAATVRAVNQEQDQIFLSYDNVSPSFDFWCSRNSRRIRPTIGFLRKSIMAPQAQQIRSLQAENAAIKQQNQELHEKLAELQLQHASSYDVDNFEYLALKKLIITAQDINIQNTDDAHELSSCDSQETEQMLLKNVRILSEWNQETKEFQKIHDEPHKELVSIRKQARIATRIEVQRQRIEHCQHDIVPLLVCKKRSVDEKNQSVQGKLAVVKDENASASLELNTLRHECDDLLSSVHELVAYCNYKIEQYNVVRTKQNSLKQRKNKYETLIEQYTQHSDSYFDLLRSFQKLQALNRLCVENATKNIQNVWFVRERQWRTWTSNDLLTWIRHQMQWLNESVVPNYLNFEESLAALKHHQIDGTSLAALKPNDLLNAGFRIHSHRITIFKHIKKLITVCVDASNGDEESDFESESMGKSESDECMSLEGQSTNLIPRRYKCHLSNRVMTEPVFCGHDRNTYDKSEIRAYIEHHHCLPYTDSAYTHQITPADYSSYLLFDDVSLEVEIQQFLQKKK